MLKVLRYRVAGWFAGRRGLPVVDAHPRPTASLVYLHRDYEARVARIYAEHLERTKGNRELVAGILAPHGERDRSRARLEESARRLEELESEASSAEPRLGEESLPEDLVRRRRARERRTMIRGARKRLEDAKTEYAGVQSTLGRARQRIETDRLAAVAEALAAIDQPSRLAAAYVAGAERTHESRTDLADAVMALMPATPEWADSTPQKELT